jgi:hypothetical protein
MNIRSLTIQLGVVLGIPAFIIGGYYLLRAEDVPQQDSRANLIEKVTKVREALATIERLKFNNALFDMPAFYLLEDQTVPVVQEESGKENPFSIPNEYLKKFSPVATSTAPSARPTPQQARPR